MPFFAEGDRGLLMVSGLGTYDLRGVLLPYVFTTFATCSCAAFLLKRLVCVNVAFSHASVPLVSLDSDHALGVRHLHCGISSVDDRHKF
jgi:hypothetical protein